MSGIKCEMLVKQGCVTVDNEQDYKIALTSLEKQLKPNEKIIVAKKIVAIYAVVKVS